MKGSKDGEFMKHYIEGFILGLVFIFAVKLIVELAI